MYKNGVITIFLLIGLLGVNLLSAKTSVTPQKIKIKRTSVLNFSSTAHKAEKQQDAKALSTKHTEEPPQHAIPPKFMTHKPIFHPPTPQGKTKVNKALDAFSSPPPSKSFKAEGDNDYIIPPDVAGAAGPNHVVAAHNETILIQDKDGNQISNMDFSDFWAGYYSYGVFDPRILYDQYSGRWILNAVSDAGTDKSSILIGCSKTDDPTGDWYLYSINLGTDGYWDDYPELGFNKKWISININLFSNTDNTYGGDVIVALDKGALYGGTLNASSWYINDGFTMQPQVTYDPNFEDLYFIEAYDYGILRISQLTGNLGSEVLNVGTSFVNSQIVWDFIGSPYPNNGPQLGTTCEITTNDARTSAVLFRNGHLFTCQTVFPMSGSSRAAIEWYELGTDGTVYQDGLIDDPSGNTWYAFPSIAANKFNELLLGCAQFSTTSYASGVYFFHSPSDPASSMRDGYNMIPGIDTYCKDFGYGTVRWGDYSSTVVDPVNDADFWTIQEYADAHVIDQYKPWSNDRFATWFDKVNSLLMPPTVTTNMISSITAQSATSGGNVTDEGSTTVSARGICWNTTGTPTISNSHTSETGTIGSFSGTMTGLSSSTVYHVRAYATNTNGTTYGEELTFKTAPNQINNLLIKSYTKIYIDLEWQRGNGDACMMTCLKGNTSDIVNPVYSTTNYAANSTYGLGDRLGSGTPENYVVYKGTGTACRVSGLTRNTQYSFKVFEYNLYNSYYCYATNNSNGNPRSRTTIPKEGEGGEWVDLDNGRIINFKLSPNPANEVLNLSLTLDESANITIEMYNMDGQNVGTQNVGTHFNVSLPVNSSYQKGQYEIPISVDKLASGSYYLVSVRKAKNTLLVNI